MTKKKEDDGLGIDLYFLCYLLTANIFLAAHLISGKTIILVISVLWFIASIIAALIK